MKKIKFNTQEINKYNKNPDWQRGVLLAVITTLGIYFFALAYLFIKPVSSDVKGVIDREVSSIDIIFDQKTLDLLDKRQEPKNFTPPVVGKNPFVPF